ncbi:MAG: MBL fold metallo-hydrolase [Bacteroidetes bacterium]|nr:MBL fold metallo-hydrolase [Bacteroidota bacterium]
MRLYSINAGYFKLDGGAMHGVVPKSMWQKANPADENNMCSWAMRCLLVEHNNRLILIDTGMGDKQDSKFFGHYHPHGEDSIARNLAKNGFDANAITDVFLTHLHFDHCGGAIKREGEQLVPAFSKATYWSHQKHWDSATHPNEREKASFLKENILPLTKHEGLLHLLDKNDGESWIDDIRIRVVNGHTDSMMLPQINFNGTTLLFCADLIPSAAHISMPWVMAYDMRPLDTLNEKKRILQEAASNNWILFFEHDPTIECATVHEVNGRIVIKETFALADWVK